MLATATASQILCISQDNLILWPTAEERQGCEKLRKCGPNKLPQLKCKPGLYSHPAFPFESRVMRSIKSQMSKNIMKSPFARPKTEQTGPGVVQTVTGRCQDAALQDRLARIPQGVVFTAPGLGNCCRYSGNN